MRLLLFTFCAAVFVASSAGAQTSESKPEAKKAGSGVHKNTSINFEDQLVEGQAQKPELFYMLKQKNANFKKLIRLRDDFLPEMRKTGEDIKGKGSGN